MNENDQDRRRAEFESRSFKPIDLASNAPKGEQLRRKQMALRMSGVMQGFLDVANDKGRTKDERIAASNELGRAVLEHFDLIVWALRTAGGARKP